MRRFFYGPKYVVPVTLVFLIVTSAASLILVRREKEAAMSILINNGCTMLDILERATLNSIEATKNIEAMVADELLSGARLVDRLENPSHFLLAEVALLNEWKGIDILDKRGKIIVSSTGRRKLPFPRDSIKPVLMGEREHVAFSLGEEEVVLASRRSSGGVIVIYADLSPLKAMQKAIGVGSIVDELLREPEIVYALLQSREGIIFATRNIEAMKPIYEDTFLLKALKSNKIEKRRTLFKGREILELAKPLYYSGEFIGLFRLGLSLENWKSVVNSGMRQILLTHLLIFIAFVLVFVFLGLRERYSRLRSWSEVLSLAFEKLPLGVIGIDKKGRIIFSNPAMRRILYLPEEGEIKEITMLGEVSKPIERALKEERVIVERVKYKRDSGELELNVFATPFSTDFMNGAIGIVEDVTELLYLEDRKRRAEELEMVLNTTAGVAHEIRNPLNAIAILIRKLEKTGVSPDVLSKIKESVEKIDEVVRRFIYLASPVSLKRTVIDLRELISNIIERERQLIEIKGVTIDFETEGENFSISLDRDKIEEAFLNILRNAEEAVEEGGYISVRLYEEPEHIIIQVEDNGPGMNEDEMKRIFEPYYSRKRGGSGMGLTIAYKTVKAHGGEIEVRRKGEGTVFTIKLKKT